MADAKLSQIEKKKKELEEELSRIQNGLDKSIGEVKEGVSSNMEPANLIKKYPLPIVGASLIVGFLLGRERKKSSLVSRSDDNRFSDHAISREVKRMLAKKGLSLFLDYLDNKLASLKEKNRSAED